MYAALDIGLPEEKHELLLSIDIWDIQVPSMPACIKLLLPISKCCKLVVSCGSSVSL